MKSHQLIETKHTIDPSTAMIHQNQSQASSDSTELLAFILSRDIQTPAYIYDEEELLDSLNIAKSMASSASCQLLYSLKACSVPFILEIIQRYVDGFSVSSVFESLLAHEYIEESQSIHIISPGLNSGDLFGISKICDYITFNSLSHMIRFGAQIPGDVHCGIRINPELSLVVDQRYDPCRLHSKLGVPISVISRTFSEQNKKFIRINGLHFHTHCEAESFEPLLRTVQAIDSQLSPMLENMSWINLGGGYLLNEIEDREPLVEAVSLLKKKYELKVFIEPGKGIVGNAGMLVAQVVDLIELGSHTIAVLDTTVNHFPEVFEYQYKPEVIGESPAGKYVYTLAGASCLAGDIFGQYCFHEPLELGSKIVFENVGSYSLVKANMFNGINLPSLYRLNTLGELELVKEFGYSDFLTRCGGDIL